MNSIYRFFVLSVAIGGAINASVLAQIEYSAGHGDIAVEYHDGELEVAWHFEDEGDTILDGELMMGSMEFEADEVFARVPTSSTLDVGNGPFADLVGGNPVWYLPITNESGVPFLGLGILEEEEHDHDGEDGHDEDGHDEDGHDEDEEPAIEWDGPITVNILNVDGPGEFTMWTPAPNFELLAATGDGLPDAIVREPGGHFHLNWGFSEPGLYSVDISASGTPMGGELLTSDVSTFLFAVGDNTVVPEPGSLALVGLGLGGLAWMRLRSSKR